MFDITTQADHLFNIVTIKVLFLSGISLASITTTIIMMVLPFSILWKGKESVKKSIMYFINLLILSISLIFASIQYKYLAYSGTENELSLKLIIYDKIQYVIDLLNNELLLSFYYYLIIVIILASAIRYLVTKK